MLGGLYGLLPVSGLTALFLVVFLSIGLAVVVTAETLLAGYRAIASGRSLSEQATDGQWYPVVRAVEVASVVLWAGGFAYLLSLIPDGPMAGPGAIGLLFMLSGISSVLLGGSLFRALSEYYYYRGTAEARVG